MEAGEPGVGGIEAASVASVSMKSPSTSTMVVPTASARAARRVACR
jgi:hypothetical protein